MLKMEATEVTEAIVNMVMEAMEVTVEIVILDTVGMAVMEVIAKMAKVEKEGMVEMD
jgi:hypothetical protein